VAQNTVGLRLRMHLTARAGWGWGAERSTWRALQVMRRSRRFEGEASFARLAALARKLRR